MLYLPVLPIYFYGVIRTRSLLYFTAANPSIDMGGFFGEKKDEIMGMIPSEYTVRGIHIDSFLTESEFAILIAKNNFEYPIIAKPNVGERGDGVKILNNLKGLVEYSKTETDFIVQEYIDYPLELGVFYYKYPNSRIGVVSSITEKKYMTVLGDGVSTIEELVLRDPRYRLYLSLLQKEFPYRLSIVPRDGEEVVVHRIGNHVKGTMFLDANRHISEDLHRAFTTLGDGVDGFYYGRYDLKVPSYEDLVQGKNIKIFELNGVSSEPGHIYNQSNFFKAVRDLAYHWLALVHISHKNIQKGIAPTPLSAFYRQVRIHFFG